MHTREHVSYPFDDTWDYLFYVSRWPATTSNHSVPDNVTTFTLHGIWPTRNDGSWPQDCNSSYPFDPSQIESLVSDLWEVWYDYEGNGFEFWSHEWDKHGTCAENLQVLRGEYNYFSTAISLHQKFDPTSVLSSAGIVPSNSQTYSESQIISAIQNAYGVKPIITCAQVNGSEGLDLVQLCITKDFNLEDCPQTKAQDSCGDNISFYPIPHA